MNMFQWARRAVVASIALTCMLSFVSIPAVAISAGGIGGRPANPDPSNPRTQSIFIFTASKGETKNDVVLVSNNSDKRQVIDLYAVDGIVTNTGAYTCSQKSEPKQNVGSWITLDKKTVSLEPGKTEEVGFKLVMPQSADVGEHNGCIVFQLADEGGDATGSVRIRTRQALRVVATVPGQLHRNIEISNFTYTYRDDKQLYALELKNSGNVSADVDAKVYVTSMFGAAVHENGGGYPVLAGKKLELNFENTKQPFFGGWYRISAKISYDNRAGAFGTADSEHLTLKSTDVRTVFIAPTAAGTLVLALTGLIVLGGIAWFISYRLRRRAMLRTWQAYDIQEGDSLQEIAALHNVSWRRLASLNRLSPPYTLKSGMVVRVPSAQSTSSKNNLSDQDE